MSEQWNHAAVLAAWHVGTLRQAALAPHGVTHRTLLVETATGSYVLRAYRYHDRARIAAEHALIAYVAAQGLPAPQPLSLPAGGTILEEADHFYALFPRARGRQIEREQLSIHEAAAMGAFLARVHQALAPYPLDRVPQRSFVFNCAATLATIGRIESAIRARASHTEAEIAALARLISQRRWLKQSALAETTSPADTPRQVIHGDFQETNLFFEHGEVSAIIDWDQAYGAPRAWEVVRALDLVFALDPVRSAEFLSAYRAHTALAAAELDHAAALYGAMRAHDVWPFKAVYLEGNERVRRFLPPVPFVSFATRWAAFRAEAG